MAEEIIAQQPVQETPKLQKVYKYLKKNNLVRSETYEDFESKMKDSKKLQRVYESLKSDPKVKADSYKDFESFQSAMFPVQAPDVDRSQGIGLIPDGQIPPVVDQVDNQDTVAPPRTAAPQEPQEDISAEAQRQMLTQSIQQDFNQIAPEQQPQQRMGNRMLSDVEAPAKPDVAGAKEFITEGYNKANDVNEKNPFVTGGKALWNVLSNDIPAGAAAALSVGMRDFRDPEMRMMPKELKAENEALALKSRKELTNWALKRQQEGANFTDDLVKSIDQVHDPLDAANYVFNALGQTTAQIPAAVGTMGISSGMQEIGSIYLGGVKRIAEEKGMTVDEVIDKGMDNAVFAATYGTLAGLLDKFGAGQVMKSFGKEAVKKSLRQRAKEVAVSGGLVEPFTEYAQTGLEQLGEEQMAGKGFSDSVKAIMDDPAKAKERIESLIQGFIGGAGLSAVGNIKLSGNGKPEQSVQADTSTASVGDTGNIQEDRIGANDQLSPGQGSVSNITEDTNQSSANEIPTPQSGIPDVVNEEQVVPDQDVNQKSGDIIPRPENIPTTEPSVNGIKETLINSGKITTDEKGNVEVKQNSGYPSQLFSDLKQITGNDTDALNEYLKVKDDAGEFKKKYGDWENSIMKEFGRSGKEYSVKVGRPAGAKSSAYAWVTDDGKGNPVIRFNTDKVKREEDFGRVKDQYLSEVVKKQQADPEQVKEYEDLYKKTITKLRDLKLHLIHQALIGNQKGDISIEDNIQSLKEIDRLNGIGLAKDYYGEPMIFMHGGDKGITKFKKPGEKGYIANDIMTGSSGIYFSRSPKGAKFYSQFSEKPQKGKELYYVFLKTKNPYYMSDPRARADYKIESSETVSKKDVEALKAKGYDSIIWDTENTPKKEVVVFEPDQVEIIGSYNEGLKSQNASGTVSAEPEPQTNGEEQTEGRQEGLLKPPTEEQAVVPEEPAPPSEQYEVPEPKVEMPPEETGTADLPEGTEVEFDWLGNKKTGKVTGFKNKRIRITDKNGVVYPKDPKDVKIVNQDVKQAKPKNEEKVVAYNSKRKKPIGIISNGLTGPGAFLFQTDLGKTLSNFFKKQFTAKGYLPQDVFNRWIKTKGEIGKYESQVKFTLDDIKKSIRSEYSGKPTDDQITDLNLALQGKTPQNPIPPKTAALIQDMRAQIDNLSKRFIDEGIVSGDLSAKFTNNLGTYLTRSYRKFDDPFWAEFVPDVVRNKAEAFLRGKYPNYSPEEIDGLINYLLHDPSAPGALLKGSKLGSKDLSLLKKRGDIAPEIRALLGEYGDPLLNYARTITKMANLVAKHHFLQDIKAQGLGKFMFDKPTGKYSVPIAAKGSKTMAPLNGLFTTPEIAEAFEEFNAMEPMADWIKWYMKVNGVVKSGKTVFSIMTHARNFMGNLGFVIMNGHYRVDKFGKAIQHAWANVYSSDQKIREKFQEYIQLGVVQDSGAAGELKNYIQDIRNNKDFFEKINDNKLKKIKNGILNTTQNLYQFEDDLYKIFAFENEYARYKNAYPNMDDQQLKEKVAKIVQDTYPTYSMVPKIVKSFRANPLVGTFVSFPAEVIRTTYNTVALAKEELSNPATRSIGATRLAGIMMSSLMPTAASYATRALLGLDGEDDEDLRRFVAPWQKNSEYLYLNVDGDKYKIIDMGYSDPHSYLKRPVYDLLKGDDLEGSVIESVKSLAAPFLSEELLAERLIDLSRNQKKTGDHVYNPDAPIGDRASDIWKHMQVAVEPGTAASLRRIVKAAGGETDKYGNKYELSNELIGLVSGQKQEVKDITQALLFRAYELKDRVDITEKELFRVTKNKTSTPEDIASAQRRHDAAMEKISDEALNIYLAAIRLGVNPKDAKHDMYRTKSAVIVKKIKQ